MKKKSPARSTASTLPAITRQHLTVLSTVLEEISRHYISRLQREISRLRSQIEHLEQDGEFTRKQTKDLKKMSTLLEHLHIQPDRGRRKDLKKIDSLISDLEKLIENW
jgi:DNA repair exonuclease SbcCD ATPase subunit